MACTRRSLHEAPSGLVLLAGLAVSTSARSPCSYEWCCLCCCLHLCSCSAFKYLLKLLHCTTAPNKLKETEGAPKSHSTVSSHGKTDGAQVPFQVCQPCDDYSWLRYCASSMAEQHILYERVNTRSSVESRHREQQDAVYEHAAYTLQTRQRAAKSLWIRHTIVLIRVRTTTSSERLSTCGKRHKQIC